MPTNYSNYGDSDGYGYGDFVGFPAVFPARAWPVWEVGVAIGDRLVKQEQRWRVERKLVSGSMHLAVLGVRVVMPAPPPPQCEGSQ